MIASWMAYASLVSVVLAIAGAALERLASDTRWPLRWIWAGALAASVLWPMATIAVSAREHRRAIDTAQPAAVVLPFTITIGVGAPMTSSNDSADRRGDEPSESNPFDRVDHAERVVARAPWGCPSSRLGAARARGNAASSTASPFVSPRATARRS